MIPLNHSHRSEKEQYGKCSARELAGDGRFRFLQPMLIERVGWVERNAKPIEHCGPTRWVSLHSTHPTWCHASTALHKSSVRP